METKTEWNSIYTYENRYQVFTKWLTDYGFEYEVRKTDLYNNGIEIVIFKPDKSKRRFYNEVFLREVFPKLIRKETKP